MQVVCLQVSRSWNVLAEDDLLWYRLYQRVASKLSLKQDIRYIELWVK